MKRVSAITVCTLAALTACSRNEPLGSNWTIDPPDQSPGDDLAEQGEAAPEASATVTQPEALGVEQFSPKSSEQPAQVQRDFAWRGLRPSLSANHRRVGSVPHRSAPVPIRSERLSQIRAQVLANLNGQPGDARLSPPAILTRQAQPQVSPSLISSTSSQPSAAAQTADSRSSQATAAAPQLISSLQASSGPDMESFSPQFSESFQLQPELSNPDLKLDEVVLFSDSDHAPQLIRASSANAAGEFSKPETLLGRQSEATGYLSTPSATAAAPILISPSRTVDAPLAGASQGQSSPTSPSPSNSQSSQQSLGPLQASSSAYVASVSEEILTNNQLDLTRFVFSDQFTLHGLPLHSPGFWLPETSSSACFKTASEQESQPLALARLQRLANKTHNSADCLDNSHYFAQMLKD